MVFCRYCGKELHETAPACPHCGAVQNKKNIVIPDGVKGWSWGAFLLNWIWAIGNRTWIGLLALIPLAGIIMAFVLGFKGREWAWRNKHWESLEHFNQVQRKWSIWGIALVACGILLNAVLAVSAYQDYVKRAKQAELHQSLDEAPPTESPQTEPLHSSGGEEVQSVANIRSDLLPMADREEDLATYLRSSLQRALADTADTRTAFTNSSDEASWLKEMSSRLAKYMQDEAERLEFLTTLHWEASRAGVDPQLMLAVIEIESGFQKYHASPRGARGYTQVMPYWVERIGSPDHNLFQLRTNLRYGALILRHYIDAEHGDLYQALGRYNGDSGRPEYPTLVVDTWKRHWDYTPTINNVDVEKNTMVDDNSVTKERREEITREQAERDRLKIPEGGECKISAECAGTLVCAKVSLSAMQCMSSSTALRQYSKFP